MSVEFPALGLSPGDVVSVDAREHWLEGAWLLAELGAPVAALFFASELTLGLRVADGSELICLSPCSLPPLPDAAFTLEHAGALFERVRRIPVAVSAFGDAPVPPASEALFADYRALGGRVLWRVATRAWAGSAAVHVERWGSA